MASSKKKWNERDTVKFVELYEAEEVLWNVRLKDYKNKDARNAAIKNITQNLNIPGLTNHDVNIKINNIRSTYSQEKAKIKKSMGTGSSVDDIYVPTLAWFEIADRFLSGVIKSRKIFQNVDSNNNTSPDIPASPSQDIPASPSQGIPASPSQEILASPSQEIPANSLPDITTIPSSTRNTPDHARFVVPSSRKRMKKTLPEYITKSIDALQSIKDQTLNSRELEDEFYHFGKNIASQLRQLPLIDALEVQSDILNLLKTKREYILQSSTSQTSTTSNDPPSEFYTIEIPEHLFQNSPNREETAAAETNMLENEDQDIHDNTLLQQAIRSIGGFSPTSEE